MSATRRDLLAGGGLTALFSRLPRSADRRAVLDVLKEQEAVRAYLPSPAARGRAARPDLLAAAVAAAPDVAATPVLGRGRVPGKGKDTGLELTR